MTKNATENGEIDKNNEFKLDEMDKLEPKVEKKEKKPESNLKTLYLFADKVDV